MRSSIVIRAGIAAVAALMMLISACGHSSNDLLPILSGYKVEYIPGTGADAPAQGKTTFQLRITKQIDGSAAAGLHPELQLTMSGMGHGTPIDSVTESVTPGYYDCTVYYLMGGTWEMQVTVEGETTAFHPTVASSMGISTKLYGPDDIVTGMSGTSYNKYYIFRDGPITAPSGTLNLYISHGEDMSMDFKPLAAGTVMSDPTGTVVDMLVSASTDSTFPGGATVSATVSNSGHFSLAGLSGLISSATNSIYVKLQVNSQDKTTNGAAPSGTNGYGTLTVMPE